MRRAFTRKVRDACNSIVSTPGKIRKKIRQSKIRQSKVNNPIQTTVGSTNTCSSFHSQG